jgi:phosphatidylinositol alpha-1,6-mannosyltransferase
MSALLITEIFPPKVGGTSRLFWEIYRRQPRERVVVAAGEDPRQEEFDRDQTLDVRRLPLNLPDRGMCSGPEFRGYWRALRALNRVVRAEGVTELHCARCVPEGWMAWLLKRWYGLPYLCYVHGEEVKLASSGDHSGYMSSRQIRWMGRRVLWDARLLIANSRNTAAILRDEWGLPAERVQVLHPGVDVQQFVPAGRDPVGRARLGWGERPVVLTVGRLQKRKGHDRMILALEAVRKVVPDVLYAVVGDGEEKDSLESLVARTGLAGHVQFLGELDDEAVLRCYQQCDLFVLPNRQVGKDIEGFGMVLLEAQACGKPVVAGTSGGTAETMHIPETGCVVSCDGPEALAAVVTELLTDPEQLARMGQAARRWVVEHFDWAAIARQAEDLFRLRDRSQPARRPAVAAPR